MAKCISKLHIRYSKRCKFMPKMCQNAFGGRAPSDSLAAIQGCLLLKGEGRKGEKEGRGREEGREEGKRRRGREGKDDLHPTLF